MARGTRAVPLRPSPSLLHRLTRYEGKLGMRILRILSAIALLAISRPVSATPLDPLRAEAFNNSPNFIAVNYVAGTLPTLGTVIQLPVDGVPTGAPDGMFELAATITDTASRIQGSHSFPGAVSDFDPGSLLAALLALHGAPTHHPINPIGGIGFEHHSNHHAWEHWPDPFHVSEPVVAPEPGTGLLLGLGLVALTASRRRSRASALSRIRH